MTGPLSNVRKLIQQFETTKSEETPQGGKTANGHSVQPPPDQSQSGHKTENLAKTIFPRTESSTITSLKEKFESTTLKGNPELRKRLPPAPPAPEELKGSAEFRARLPKAPPLPTEEELAQLKQEAPEKDESTQTNFSSSTSETEQKDLADPQRNSSISEQVTIVWQQVQTPQARPIKEVLTPEQQAKREEANKILSEQLVSFNAAIQRLQVDNKFKINVTRDGKIDLKQRRFGFRFGRSRGTKEMAYTLDKMRYAAINSKSPELLSQYITMLKDLRATKWGKDIEKNPQIKATFDKLLSEAQASFITHTSTRTDEAIKTAISSTNRQDLVKALQTLKATQNLSMAPDQVKIAAAISTATATLGRTNDELFKAHLLGQDPYMRGRELLLKAAGEVVKPEKYIDGIKNALQDINEAIPEKAIEGLRALTEAAVILASLPKDQLDELHNGATLRQSLENIHERAASEKDEQIGQAALALNIMLAEDSPMSKPLENFRNAVDTNNSNQAFSAALLLTSLTRGELEKPLFPDRSDSPTVRQAMINARNIANRFPENRTSVGAFDLLMATNAEKIETTPLTTSLIANAYSIEEGLQFLREGKVRSSERKEFIAALTDDLRAQFGSLIKLTGTKEFANLAWSKPKTEHLSPQLLAGTTFHTKFSNGITTSILNSNLDEADRLINFYVDLADSCLKDRNYAAVTAIIAALNSSPIRRLMNQPGVLSEEKTQFLQSTEALLNPQGSYKALREAVSADQRAHRKPIPYTGTLMSDLTFTVEGNPDEVAIDTQHSAINLKKVELIDDNLQFFRQLRDALSVSTERKTDLVMQPAPEIKGPVKLPPDAKPNPTTDDLLYYRSLQLLPKKSQSL